MRALSRILVVVTLAFLAGCGSRLSGASPASAMGRQPTPAASTAALYRAAGEALRKCGDLAAAATYLRRLLEMRPQDVLAAQLLAVMESRMLRPSAAKVEAYLQRALEVRPFDASVHLTASHVLLELGALDQAVEYALSGVALATTREEFVEAQVLLYRAAVEAGEQNAARATLERIRSLDPALAEAEAGRGRKLQLVYPDFVLRPEFATHPRFAERIHRLAERFRELGYDVQEAHDGPGEAAVTCTVP